MSSPTSGHDFIDDPLQAELAPATVFEADVDNVPILLPDIPHHVYHADPWGPSLSQSTATTLLSCPLKAWAGHPRLGGQSGHSSEAMDLGSIAHELVLGKGAGFEVLPFDSWRTDLSKDKRSEARAAGKVPLLQKDFDAAFVAAQQVVGASEGLFDCVEGAETEVTILWKEGDVLCRCRIDHLVVGDGWASITDLKWYRTADPLAFQRNAKTSGHDIQAAAYIRAVEAVYPKLAGRVRFEFLLVEQGPPVIVQPVEMAGSMRSLGEGRWKRAVKLWAKCLKENHWPGYADGPVEIDALPWQLSDDFAQAIKLQGDPTAAWGEGESAEGGGE